MSHSYYPIALDLHDKPCLVVGGGEIADGKLDALLGGRGAGDGRQPRGAAADRRAGRPRDGLRSTSGRTDRATSTAPSSSSPPPTTGRSMPAWSPRARRGHPGQRGRRHPLLRFLRRRDRPPRRSAARHLDQRPQPGLRALDARAARRDAAGRIRRTAGGARRRARHAQGARADPGLRALAGGDHRRGARRAARWRPRGGDGAILAARVRRPETPTASPATERRTDPMRQRQGLDRRRRARAIRS